MTRQERDRERYLRERERRLIKQREYYSLNRDKCLEAVKRCQQKRMRESYERRTTTTATDGGTDTIGNAQAVPA